MGNKQLLRHSLVWYPCSSVITRIPYSFWGITNTSNVINYVLSYYEFCCIGMMYLVNCLQLLHRQLAIDSKLYIYCYWYLVIMYIISKLCYCCSYCWAVGVTIDYCKSNSTSNCNKYSTNCRRLLMIV